MGRLVRGLRFRVERRGDRFLAVGADQQGRQVTSGYVDPYSAASLRDEPASSSTRALR